jgi:hypothetical protein
VKFQHWSDVDGLKLEAHFGYTCYLRLKSFGTM